MRYSRLAVAAVVIVLACGTASAQQAGNEALDITPVEAQISRQIVRVVMSVTIRPESKATSATLHVITGYFLDQAERRYELSAADIKPGTLLTDPVPDTRTIAAGDTYRYPLTYLTTGDVGLETRIYKVFLYLDGAMDPIDVPVASH